MTNGIKLGLTIFAISAALGLTWVMASIELGLIMSAILAALGVWWGVAYSRSNNPDLLEQILTVAQPYPKLPEWDADGGECVVVDYSSTARRIIKNSGYSTWKAMKPQEMEKCRYNETHPRPFNGGIMNDKDSCNFSGPNFAPGLCAYYPPAYFTPPKCQTASDLNDLTKDIMKRCCMYDLRHCQNWKDPKACHEYEDRPGMNSLCNRTLLEVEKVCRDFLRKEGDSAKAARDGINAAIEACLKDE